MGPAERGGDGEVEVETPTDVRMYVDRRCAESVCWMEEVFCRRGSEGRGVKLDIAGQSVDWSPPHAS